ncbi:hypothetical protein KI387_028790, partial [Taxus chinensis]
MREDVVKSSLTRGCAGFDVGVTPRVLAGLDTIDDVGTRQLTSIGLGIDDDDATEDVSRVMFICGL